MPARSPNREARCGRSLAVHAARWLLLRTTPITQDWDRAPVLATADGALVGFVIGDGTTQHVQPISETLAAKVQGKATAGPVSAAAKSGQLTQENTVVGRACSPGVTT
jgi:hypothetical protein